jgi:hypothetical protein
VFERAKTVHALGRAVTMIDSTIVFSWQKYTSNLLIEEAKKSLTAVLWKSIAPFPVTAGTVGLWYTVAFTRGRVIAETESGCCVTVRSFESSQTCGAPNLVCSLSLFVTLHIRNNSRTA